MRIEQLMFLREVANTKSMSVAASNLYVTPQYISKAIKLLEEELGTKIFRRSKTGVYLTINGEKIYEMTVNILDQLDEMAGTFQVEQKKTTELPAGRHTIFWASEVKYLFKNIFAEFLAEYPGLSLNFIEKDSLYIMNEMHEKHIKPEIAAVIMEKGDLAISESIVNEYDIYTIGEDVLRVVAAADNDFLDEQNILRNGVTMKKLLKVPFAFCMENEYNMMIQLLAKHELKTNIKLLSNSMEDVIDFIKQKVCVTVTGGMMANELQKEGLCSIPIADKITVIYRLFVRRDCKDDAFTITLLNTMQNMYQESFRKIH